MSAGKGSRPRPVNGAKFRRHFDAIFRKAKKPAAKSLTPHHAKLDAR